MADGAHREDLPTFYGRLCRIYSNPPAYNALWRGCVAQVIPAERVGSRWRVLPGAEEAAVAAFGLRPHQQQSAA
jgi:hypothetical protein